jgi:hypothetical protein
MAALAATDAHARGRQAPAGTVALPALFSSFHSPIDLSVAVATEA